MLNALGIACPARYQDLGRSKVIVFDLDPDLTRCRRRTGVVGHLSGKTDHPEGHARRTIVVTNGITWPTFLKTHGRDVWSCDFVTVVTPFFQTLYTFVIMHVNVTRHPTKAWVAQHIRDITPCGETAKHLIRANDTTFGLVIAAAAKTCRLKVTYTPIRVTPFMGL